MALLPLAVGACDLLHDRPSDEELAAFCGVALPEFKVARSEIKKAKPYQARDIGKCSLIRDDTGKVVVTSVQWPPKAPAS